MHQQTATSNCGATQSGLRHWAWMLAGFVMNLLFHLSRIRLARKIVRPFYLLAVWTWERLPPPVLEMGLVRRLGYRINELVLFRNVRYPNNGTYMLRNRPELDLIHDIAATAPAGSMFRIAVLGCSIGMEVYSIRWRLRDLAPEYIGAPSLPLKTYIDQLINKDLRILMPGAGNA